MDISKISKFSLYGRDLFGDPVTPKSRGTLSDSFVMPPFSVLDARHGAWQERKRAWLSLGIKSELGRGNSAEGQKQTSSLKGSLTISTTCHPFDAGKYGDDSHGGTSIFDPVLCELAYRWFAPLVGSVLDPFAGGSVRGIVASKLGLRYTGIDLRAEQVCANREQGATLCAESQPRWIEGDSRDAIALAPEPCDLLFSCPPYGSLERYSDDPRDLSTMDYPSFLSAYREVVAASVSVLREDRFACFVVGDIRDKRGHYCNFVGDTVAAFRDAGMPLYNEAVLVTQAASLPIRARRQFEAGRKLWKTHQNVLVFVKGDWRKAAAVCRLGRHEEDRSLPGRAAEEDRDAP